MSMVNLCPTNLVIVIWDFTSLKSIRTKNIWVMDHCSEPARRLRSQPSEEASCLESRIHPINKDLHVFSFRLPIHKLAIIS